MFKLIEVSVIPKTEMLMKDMPPCSLAFIDEGKYRGNIVLRTASCDKLEVMDLTNPGECTCWTGNPSVRVKMLAPGEKIVLEVT